MQIRENIPISELTTMRLGGAARYVIETTSSSEVIEAWDFAKTHNLPFWPMGGGANTIGHDEGFPGVIVLNRSKGIFLQTEASLIPIAEVQNQTLGSEIILKAMAGEVWDDLVAASCDLGYSGIEALSMIPGTVGAAPVQNIGAYGQDLAQVIQTAEVLDTITGEILTLTEPEMGMTYRHTRFNYGADAGRFIILSITIRLTRTSLQPPFYTSLQAYVDSHNITDFSPASIRHMVCEIRSSKLPDPAKIASAGSFFGNIYLSASEAKAAETKGIPVWSSDEGGKINSGWLIEQCGLKGKELFGFRVSDQAALILINESATSYADLDRARRFIVETVKDKFGYTLEQEPVEIPIK